MDVSIVIPVKNGGKRFAEVLGMVFRQETKYEYEVICVDILPHADNEALPSCSAL